NFFEIHNSRLRVSEGKVNLFAMPSESRQGKPLRLAKIRAYAMVMIIPLCPADISPILGAKFLGSKIKTLPLR
ncbi:MAG: hypothetical protein J6L75_01525, partial [Alistipes sp.]|nr:hypothetical protein [Alistipes sp.]